MKRRGFIKGLFAAGALAAVPLTVAAAVERQGLDVFKFHTARTGRFSSKHPNISNIPSHRTEAPTPGEVLSKFPIVDPRFPARTPEKWVAATKKGFRKWDREHGESHVLTFRPSEREFIAQAKRPGTRVGIEKVANHVRMWTERT